MSDTTWTRGGTYSGALRCAPCGQRAVLSEEAAQRLVAASGERLVAYGCPVAPGVHVVNPVVEGAVKRG